MLTTTNAQDRAADDFVLGLMAERAAGVEVEVIAAKRGITPDAVRTRTNAMRRAAIAAGEDPDGWWPDGRAASNARRRK